MLIPFKGTVLIKNAERILNAFFKVDAVDLEFQGFGGQMVVPPFRILSLERGDAVAAIVHDTSDDTVLLVEQFRYPTYAKSGGWIYELVAGMLKPGEDPLEAILRELLEEAGYEAKEGRYITTFYVSPGGTSERIHLYYVAVSPSDEKTAGGGLDHEGEDIRRHMVKAEEAFVMLETGVIQDAKTIIGLQWLQYQRS